MYLCNNIDKHHIFPTRTAEPPFSTSVPGYVCLLGSRGGRGGDDRAGRRGPRDLVLDRRRGAGRRGEAVGRVGGCLAPEAVGLEEVVHLVRGARRSPRGVALTLVRNDVCNRPKGSFRRCNSDLSLPSSLNVVLCRNAHRLFSFLADSNDTITFCSFLHA